MEFASALQEYQSDLAIYPGDSQLLKIGLNKSQKYLEEGDPQKSMALLLVAFEYSSGSPLRGQIEQQLELAADWVWVRKAIDAGDTGEDPFNKLVTLAGKLSSAANQKLSAELSGWFEIAVALRNLAQAERFAAIEKKLWPQTVDRSAEIETLRAQLNEEDRLQREAIEEAARRARLAREEEERLRRQTMENKILQLRSQNTPEALKEAGELVSQFIATLPSDDPEVQDLKIKSREIAERKRILEIAISQANQLEKAQYFEAQANSLKDSLNLEDLDAAISNLEQAGVAYAAAGKTNAAQKMRGEIEIVRRSQNNLPEFKQTVEKVRADLANMETVRTWLAQREMLAVDLVGLCLGISKLRQLRMQSSTTRELSSQALVMARSLGWDDKSFWALVNPSQLDGTVQQMLQPLPAVLDFYWLGAMRLVFKNSPELAGLPHERLIEIQDLVNRWLTEETTHYLQLKRQREFDQAVRRVPGIRQLVDAVRLTMRVIGSKPADSPAGSIEGRQLAEELVNAGDEAALDSLMQVVPIVEATEAIGTPPDIQVETEDAEVKAEDEGGAQVKAEDQNVALQNIPPETGNESAVQVKTEDQNVTPQRTPAGTEDQDGDSNANIPKQRFSGWDLAGFAGMAVFGLLSLVFLGLWITQTPLPWAPAPTVIPSASPTVPVTKAPVTETPSVCATVAASPTPKPCPVCPEPIEKICPTSAPVPTATPGITFKPYICKKEVIVLYTNLPDAKLGKSSETLTPNSWGTIQIGETITVLGKDETGASLRVEVSTAAQNEQSKPRQGWVIAEKICFSVESQFGGAP